tara:strand:+ start:109 stop:1911 length:1803 start_codon:yes stop_codon:yes gene_type:complete
MYKIHLAIIITLLSSCSGGGASSDSSFINLPDLVFNISGIASKTYSYDEINLNISSNYAECDYSVLNPHIYWLTESNNIYSFNAPITFFEEESFDLIIKSIPSSSCPSAQKSINLIVNRFDTQYEAIPKNHLNLKTTNYHSADIGFGGINLTERYSATICYPTPQDCTSYVNQLFGQDAHNIATGDFNNDGFEDLVVAWAIFPHTIEESQKINAPINIYLNNGNGHFYEDLSLYEDATNPTHPFAYRLAIADYNSDGIDDIFASSMGRQVRHENASLDYISPYPHLLLLSNSEGQLINKSLNIEDQNNGLGQKCGFAHDASTGDFDGDGDFDIYACNILLVNDGLANFSIHSFINNNWNNKYRNPMSSIMDDLNNDGFDDLIFWNFDNRNNIVTQPEEGTILLSNNTSDISTWTKIDLPKGPHNINHNKYNHASSGDLNGDGYIDIVVSVTRDDPYYQGAFIQVLINDQTGRLVDETSGRFVNQARKDDHHGEGNIYLRDIDKDGDLDIFHSTRDFVSSLSGAHIAINDGYGNFISNESLLPERPISNASNDNTRALMKGVPIDIDQKGCLDLISSTDSWSDQNATKNYLYSIINIDCSF